MGGAENKDTANVVSAKESPSAKLKAKVISTKSAPHRDPESVPQPNAIDDYYINPSRPLSPCQLINSDEHVDSCIRAVVVSEIISSSQIELSSCS